MATVMITDHDAGTLAKLQSVLGEDGNDVVSLNEPSSIIETARTVLPDLLILDMDFPNTNSLIICNELRSLPHLTHIPILFLTSHPSDIVDALDAGGDDLVVKPIDYHEVAARVRALLRRAKRVTRLHSLRIDSGTKQVWVNDQPATLTPTEFNLLAYLCEHETSYHKAKDLLEFVWRYPGGAGDTALIRNHVHNLRTKLENLPNRPQIIVSLHGRGYRVNADIEYHTPQGPRVHDAEDASGSDDKTDGDGIEQEEHSDVATTN
jgi:two-component system, OmpR family, response regulator MtrA